MSSSPKAPQSSSPGAKDKSSSRGRRQACEMVVDAVHNFKAMERHQLSIEAGERLVILERDPSGWWIGRNVFGKVGLVPSPFVKEAKVPCPQTLHLERMTLLKEAIQQKLGVAEGVTSVLGRYIGAPVVSEGAGGASGGADDAAIERTKERRRASLRGDGALGLPGSGAHASKGGKGDDIADAVAAATDELLAMSTLQIHDEFKTLSLERAAAEANIQRALLRIARLQLHRREADITGDRALLTSLLAHHNPNASGNAVAGASLALATAALLETSAEEMERHKRDIMVRRLETTSEELRELAEREQMLLERLRRRNIPVPSMLQTFYQLRAQAQEGKGGAAANESVDGTDGMTQSPTEVSSTAPSTVTGPTSSSPKQQQQVQQSGGGGGDDDDDRWLEGLENPSTIRYLRYLQHEFQSANARLDEDEMILEALATKHKSLEKTIRSEGAVLEELDAKTQAEAAAYVAEWRRRVERAKGAYERLKADAAGDGGLTRLQGEIDAMKGRIDDGKATYLAMGAEVQEWSAKLEELQRSSSLRQQADGLRRQIEGLDAAVKAAEASYQEQANTQRRELAESLAAYKKLEKQRRETYNSIQDLKGNLRVYCRIKPLGKGEVNECVSVVDDMTVRVMDIDTDRTTDHEFDLVIPIAASQEEIFEEVKPLATSVLDGYNVCIFAYGQTGSGKTYTMEGPPSNRGINYRTVKELFQVAKEREGDYRYTLSVSVLEIYNDKVFDLLGGRTPSKVRWAGDETGVVVEPLQKRPVSSADQVQETLDKAYANRTVAGTDCNAHSSRSHCVVSVYVVAVNAATNTQLRGKLHLIDLAGSERVKQSGVEGDRLKEATHINSSLSHLKTVIQALAGKKKFVAYRNSMLTSLLQDSLGGNCKCLMFANISAANHNVPESLCTIKYAAEARKVEVGTVSANVKGPSK